MCSMSRAFSFQCRSHQGRLPRQRLRRPRQVPDLPDLADAEPAPEGVLAVGGSRRAEGWWFPDLRRDPGSVGRQSFRFSLLVTGDEAASEMGVPKAALHDKFERAVGTRLQNPVRWGQPWGWRGQSTSVRCPNANQRQCWVGNPFWIRTHATSAETGRGAA